MGDQKKKIILSKPEDWDTWINFVRIKVETHEVWNLIDPDHSSKPVALTKLNKPTFDHIPFSFPSLYTYAVFCLLSPTSAISLPLEAGARRGKWGKAKRLNVAK